jgi:hypothetical protein
MWQENTSVDQIGSCGSIGTQVGLDGVFRNSIESIQISTDIHAFHTARRSLVSYC